MFCTGVELGRQAVTRNLPDAYDGAFVMAVDGTTYRDPDGILDVVGTTVDATSTNLSGLQVQGQFQFFATQQVVRALYAFTNPGSEPITTTVLVAHNVGADERTTLNTTSSGDTTLDASDPWLITGGGLTDPTLTWSRYGMGAGVLPTNVQSPGNGEDEWGDQYTLTIQPGDTTHLMLFGGRSDDPIAAATNASTFNDLSSVMAAGLVNDLSQEQLDTLANWVAGAQQPTVPVAVPLFGGFGFWLVSLATGGLGMLGLRRRRRRQD